MIEKSTTDADVFDWHDCRSPQTTKSNRTPTMKVEAPSSLTSSVSITHRSLVRRRRRHRHHRHQADSKD